MIRLSILSLSILILLSARHLQWALLHLNITQVPETLKFLSLATPIDSPNAILQVITERPVVCRYSIIQNTPYDLMEGSFDLNLGTLHKKTLLNLLDGIYTFYIGCRNNTDLSNTILSANFNVAIPASAQITLSDNHPLRAGGF